MLVVVVVVEVVTVLVVEVDVDIDVLLDVDVVLVVVSQPLHVLAHCSEKTPHNLLAKACSHFAKGNVFILLAHLPGVVVVDVVVVDIVVVDVVVVSHPLHVLSHWPNTLAHKSCANMVWH